MRNYMKIILLMLLLSLLFMINIYSIQPIYEQDFWKTLEDDNYNLNGFGISFKSLDYNADGYDDLLVSDGYYHVIQDTSVSNFIIRYGKIYLYYGSTSGLPDSASFTILPSYYQYPNGVYQFSIVGPGDFNGDGYNDFGLTRAEKLYSGYNVNFYIDFYYGGPDADSIPDFTYLIEEDYDEYAYFSPINIGDVNGDGCDDLMITWGEYVRQQLNMYYEIIYGGSFERVHFCTLYNNEGSGKYPIGDINADGYDDFSINFQTGNFYNFTAENWIFFGSENPDSSNCLLMSEHVEGELDLGEMYSRNIGDFNGDGYNDCLAYILFGDGEYPAVWFGGAGNTPNIGLHIGNNFSYYRHYGNISYGDFNGDGKDDLLRGYGGGNGVQMLSMGGINGTVDYLIWSPQVQQHAGYNCMGDFDGDGYDDIAFGGPGEGGYCPYGRIFLIKGGPSYHEQDPDVSTIPEDFVPPLIIFKAYPNPSQKNISFFIQSPEKKSETYSIRIHNIKGQLLHTIKVTSNNGKAKSSIDLNHLKLASGVYLAKLYKGDQGISVKKFTIIR
ncbi:MAG: T9SS type A sorting domain-containing protein [Candidatus Cloacimonetes bacterium]|nr:T9SS type A sorting domain-containing protein [Candidatus Cloacimonadota bacterium]MDD3501223.1 T9SS type A sorting domain-containing protein [Candidatus Cloacimonadota bacterium]